MGENDDGECPVCLSATSTRCLPCQHPLCDSCATKWCNSGRYTCPLCRVVMVPAVCGDAISAQGGRTLLTFSFNANAQPHMGITLSSSSCTEGVRVHTLHAGDYAHASGVRVGDIVTHINAVPVSDHGIAVRMIEGARHHGLSIVLAVRRRSLCRSVLPMMHRFVRCSRHPASRHASADVDAPPTRRD